MLSRQWCKSCNSRLSLPQQASWTISMVWLKVAATFIPKVRGQRQSHSHSPPKKIPTWAIWDISQHQPRRVSRRETDLDCKIKELSHQALQGRRTKQKTIVRWRILPSPKRIWRSPYQRRLKYHNSSSMMVTQPRWTISKVLKLLCYYKELRKPWYIRLLKPYSKKQLDSDTRYFNWDQLVPFTLARLLVHQPLYRQQKMKESFNQHIHPQTEGR